MTSRLSRDHNLVRDLILENITSTPRSGRLIYDRVNAAYGSLLERRFWYILNRLVELGIVNRTGAKKHAGSGYHKP